METPERGLRPDGAPARPAAWLLVFWGAVAVAALLRVWGFWTRPFWVSEIQEIVMARHPRSWGFSHAGAGDLVGFAWHHIVWWLGISDGLELWDRVPAVVCGIAAVPATYVLGKRLHSERVGLSAAILLSVSFIHVYHSQDARSLSYMALGAPLSALGLVRVVLDGRWRWAPAYLLGAALLAGSHLFGVPVALLQAGAFLLVAEARGRKADAGARDHGADAGHLGRATHAPGSGSSPLSRPMVRLLLLCAWLAACLAAQVWGSGFFFFQSRTDMPGACPEGMTLADRLAVARLAVTYLSSVTGVLVLVPAVVALLGFLHLWWRDRGIAFAAVLGLVAPAGLLLLARLAGRLERLDLSHLLFVVPVWCIVMAAGVEAVVRFAASRWERLRQSATAAVLGLTLAAAVLPNVSPLARYYARGTRLFVAADFPAAARFIEEQGLSDTDLLAFSYSVYFIPMNWYTGRLFRDKGALVPARPAGPSELPQIMMHLADANGRTDRPLLYKERVRTFAEFASREQPYTGTVWLLAPHYEPLEEVCSVAAYSRWFGVCADPRPVVSIPSDAVPPGAHFRSFDGLDVVWKRYDRVSREEVRQDFEPLAVRFAHPMARAFLTAPAAK